VARAGNSSKATHHLISALGNGIYFGCGEAAGERERLLLADGDAAAAAFTTSAGFDRDPRLRVGVASDFPPAFTDAAATAGFAAWSTSTLGLRPSPSFFAIIDRRSEYAGAVSG